CLDALPHRVSAAVPLVEITDDTDPPRIRRPDGEADPRHAVEHHRVRAKAVIEPPVAALAEEMHVEFAKDRRKPVRVPRLPACAVAGQAKPVSERLAIADRTR